MKKGVILLLCILLFSYIPITASAQEQRIWGEAIAYEEDGNGGYLCTLRTDNGTITVSTSAMLEYDFAWFTINNENVVTDIEYIPEAGYEIGLFMRAYIDLATENPYVRVFHQRMQTFECKYYHIYEQLKDYTGMIAYRLDPQYKMYDVILLSTPRQTLENVKYEKERSGFEGLNYKITPETEIMYLENPSSGLCVNKFTSFDENLYYTFDVIGCDKDYNAKTILIHKISSNNMIGFYTKYKLIKNDSGAWIYLLSLLDENGSMVEVPLSEDMWPWTVDGVEYDQPEKVIAALESSSGLLECEYNNIEGATSIRTLKEPSEFSNLEYNRTANTLGGYSMDETAAFDIKLNTYYKVSLDESHLYNGKAYLTSDNRTVLWIEKSCAKPGLPTITFTMNEEGRHLTVSAEVENNGYQGNATVYLAVYKNDRLRKVCAGSLRSGGINESIPLENNESGKDFVVKGFVWKEDLRPLFSNTEFKMTF